MLLRGYDGGAAGYDDVGGQDSRGLLFMLLRCMMVVLLVRMMLEDKTVDDLCSCC